MTDCPVCNQKNNHEILKAWEKFNVIRCSNCESIYSNFSSINCSISTSNKIGADSINKLNILNLPRFLLNRYSSKIVADFDVYYLQKHIDFELINSAFDIGSKYGFLVKNFLDLGIDAHGIDATRHPQTVAKKNITYGYFDENYNDGRRYDLITMGDILYINPDAHKILKKAIKMLARNGFLFITSFNPNSEIIHEIIERHGIGPILYISKKGFERICMQNNCTLINFTCTIPKVFVVKVCFRNKLRSLISLIGCSLKIDKGFDEKQNGIRSYILLKKNTE